MMTGLRGQSLPSETIEQSLFKPSNGLRDSGEFFQKVVRLRQGVK